MDESSPSADSPLAAPRGAWRERVLGWAVLVSAVLAASACAAIAGAALWQHVTLIADCAALARAASPPRSLEPAAASTRAAPTSAVASTSSGTSSAPLRQISSGGSLAPAPPPNVADTLTALASVRSLDPAEASEKAVTIGGAWPPAYERTECDDVFVYIVTVAERAPAHSAASLGLGKNGRARFRQPGQTLGGWEVLAITDDWTGLDPAVWLVKDKYICRAQLAGNPSRLHSPLREPQKRQRAKRKRPRQRRR